MSKQSKRGVLALGIVTFALVAGVAFFLWSPGEPSIDKTVMFSDGTTMTLKRVTYGTEHRYLRGNLNGRCAANRSTASGSQTRAHLLTVKA